MHPPVPHSSFVGRQSEGHAILLSAQAGRSVVLVAPTGYGKSALLSELTETFEELAVTVRLQKLAPFGTFIVDLFEGLHAAGLRVPGAEASDPLRSWKKAHAGNDAKARSLHAALRAHAASGCTPPILVVDDATGLTQSMVPWLLALGEHAALIQAVQPDTMRKAAVSRWWNRCDRVDLGPLTREESRQLVDGLSRTFGIVAQDQGAYRNRVLSLSEGVPGEISRLVRYTSAHDLVQNRDIGTAFAQQAAQRQERGVALAPMLLLLGAVAMVTKYVGLARGEMDMYLVGGVGIAVFMVGGPFIRKLMVAR